MNQPFEPIIPFHSEFISKNANIFRTNFSNPHRCHNYSKKKVEERCRARCVLVNGLVKSLTGGPHNHPPHTEKIEKIQKRSEPTENIIHTEYWSLENLSDVEIGEYQEDNIII